MRIGDVALDAVDKERARQRAAAADFDAIAEHFHIAGLAEHEWSNFSPRAAAHCNNLTVPLTEMSSSSPVIRNEIEPLPFWRGLPPWAARWSSTAATLQAIPPFISTAPRP